MDRSLSQQKPGVTLSDSKTYFCFYCPNATSVECLLYDRYDADQGTSHKMKRDSHGYWQLTLNSRETGKWYGYKAGFKESEKENHSPYKNRVFADPYSLHVTVKNNYKQEARSYIFENDFDWEDDEFCFPDDPRDLIIYETHIKDLTAHPSSKSKGKGFYQKFADPDQKGGISHLKNLGVNCVEFLPLQKFPPIEPPYGKITDEEYHNTWNVYSANYWGYMTSFFFAPESSFASDFSHNFSGKTPAAVNEFKHVVKSLHKEGITVLMDVVYNHTSLFDLNPLTHLCPDEYLRKDENGHYLNRSGTGNEYRSENPVARQLMIDSLLYWMDEYHIDGFRFDLAALLDKQSWKIIRSEIHKKYPNAVLIAEPWGGYYSPHHFSNHDWASWNDRIRNSIKGSDPLHDKGFIFSDWQHETRRERLENIFKGTLNHGEGGLYNTSAHSVNYLESHDGYTLGDFIRIGLNPELHDQPVEDIQSHVTLNETQLSLSKLAALSMFCTQGITMIHAGQEFARSKIVAKSTFQDSDEGKMDHNSYQKDNETNWINFNHIQYNSELYKYYKALIQIRKDSPALRKCEPEEICFDHFGNPLVISFFVSGISTDDIYDYYVILNGSSDEDSSCNLPGGSWELLANHELASPQMIDILSETVTVKPQSGLLLRKLRH